MKTKQIYYTVLLLAFLTAPVSAQQEKIAVLNIDTKGITLDEVSMGNLVRLEVEKTGKYNVLDKYDLDYLMKEKNLDYSDCYGRICLVDMGKVLNADKMLTGRVEKFDNKIIFILRLIDVHAGTTEQVDIMEYLDLPELQQMVQISVNNVLGIENEMNKVEMLSDYDDPINTPKSKLRLNGPRMGFSYIGGEYGDILRDREYNGGYDAFPATALIGYQFEKSYLSAGDFQALFEFIPFIGGLEQSRIIPSITIMNGFRSSKSGLEFGVGPVFELNKKTKGYYVNDKWYTVDEGSDIFGSQEAIPHPLETRIDSRGDYELVTAWIFALGKTFKSGYLNIPVNVYFSPRKNGYVVGGSFGFNVSKK
ncbi:MAG: hypothetical protein GVY19_07660 [Bacteroidetes bacterium]|jgi:hypothetical protein|nr:hypothetical protein [Bacteroidota bacterium]